ncbi:hypothetical protein RJ639_031767 [Escallonia herrerae]|uniref:Inhibitor I9 domain-containing protein n=1 Tax=Escallonia herrerae TaxID=1293975 RepID=A0AA89BCR4_9ASTE|nr:hypothetical protein RJ639_031767 [Escallonia herrerae]
MQILKSSFLCLSVLFSIVTISMAETAESAAPAAVHIIYTQEPDGEEPEAFHIRTLASVLGSEDAAKEAILYSYKHAASGFSAKLTPHQVSQISSTD